MILGQYLQSDEMAQRYRAMAIDVPNSRILVTNFRNTAQEEDLSVPPNCGGFGRIRHFVRSRDADWPSNPLPIDPACRALNLPSQDKIRAQLFQNAVCNWRCWYCFVPFPLLDGRKAHSQMMSVGNLIDLWSAEQDRPKLIDLSGGQPEIVHEWILWTMRELLARNLDKEVYLWSDDNLSTDYFWRYLTNADREFVRSYPMYGRVCCLKGFDPRSFSFNTSAAPEEYDRQFVLLRRLVELGLDLYCYVTLTTDDTVNLEAKISTFVDRLRSLDENLPLRTIPLKIEVFGPTQNRLTPGRTASLMNQCSAVDAWSNELERRYSTSSRAIHISDVPLVSRRAL
jgi:uncharacterized Fe-S cluster-containing radical SAM superfamily protein